VARASRWHTGAAGSQLRSCVVPRYMLLSEEGEDLGLFKAVASTWAPGDTIPRRPGNSLVVVNVTEALEGDDVDGYLVVRAE